MVADRLGPGVRDVPEDDYPRGKLAKVSPISVARHRETAVRRRGFAVAVATVALFVSACSSTSPAGSSSGGGDLPDGDHVHALRATDDGALLLGLHGALWRSADGTSWQQLGLEGHDAMALGVAAEGQPLLVGGHDVLARSSDGGETFEMLDPSDLPSLDIHALAQAPSEPRTVYAYVVGHGIYRSTDTGDPWQRAYRGVDVSNDGGRSWDLAAGTDSFDGQPLAVAIGPDGTWWVMTEKPRVLYRSQNGDGGFEEVARA